MDDGTVEQGLDVSSLMLRIMQLESRLADLEEVQSVGNAIAPANVGHMHDIGVDESFDWVAYDAASYTLTLRKGYVECATDSGTLYLSSSTDNDPTVVLPPDDDCYIYAYIADPNAAGATYTLAVTNTLANLKAATDAHHWAKWLWYCKTDGGVVINVQRIRNVEFPGWRQ